MRKPRRDPLAAEEAIMGKVVFLAVFITLSSLFIAQGYNLWSSSDSGNWDALQGYQILGDYTFISLLPLEGYDFNPATNYSNYVQTWSLTGDGDAFVFDEDDLESDDAVRVWVITENDHFLGSGNAEDRLYMDFFYVRCDYGGLFGMWDTFTDVVSYGSVLANKLPGTNASLTPVHLGHRSYTLFINTTGASDSFTTDLYAGIFNIRMVLTTEDQTPSGSMWAIIGQVLTADVPNVHWLVNLILFTIIWSMIAVIVIEVWARLWPL